MSNVNTNIEGIDEVIKTLESLPLVMSNKLIIDAHKQILNQVLRKPLINAIPYSQKTKKITIVKDSSTKTGVFIGPSTKTFWLRFLTFGTKERETKKGLKKGMISARETGIIGTIDSKINEVIEVINKDFGAALVKAMAKQLKKVTIKK